MWGYRNDSREGSFFCDAIIENRKIDLSYNSTGTRKIREN